LARNSRQPSAVTPSTSTKNSTQNNQFIALSPDKDDEEFNRSNNNNSNHASDISAASSIDSDYQDLFDDSLGEDTPTGTVLDGLDSKTKWPSCTPSEELVALNMDL